MNRRAKAFVAVLGTLVLHTAALADWKAAKLDSVHTRVGFTASTLLFDVPGQFKSYQLQIDGDPTKPTQAKVMLTIDAATINTDNSKRDEHLSSADFFDVKTFPKISFVSERIAQNGNTLSMTGTLDMHGHKKKVTIPFTVAKGKNGAGVDSTAYKGKLTVKRSDFGIGADSVAAKISLDDAVNLDLLIVGLF